MQKNYMKKFYRDKNVFRTIFMQDRDKILYKRSFFRLSEKTQVYANG